MAMSNAGENAKSKFRGSIPPKPRFDVFEQNIVMKKTLANKS